jgi:hypothetical protein
MEIDARMTVAWYRRRCGRQPLAARKKMEDDRVLVLLFIGILTLFHTKRLRGPAG